MPPPRPINLPFEINPDVAYLIGVIMGDGSIMTPIKRKKGGYYWKIQITSKKDYSDVAYNLLWKIFGCKPSVFRDKRKKDCWYVYLHSKEVHNYFTNVIGIPAGKKAGNMPWLKNCCVTKEIFRHFLAGLIDTDGYIGKKYISLVQKDKNFLEKMKSETADLLNINFTGPYVNKKINGKILAWTINISKKDEMANFLKTIPLRYKMPS